jgi:hypothetical protein
LELFYLGSNPEVNMSGCICCDLTKTGDQLLIYFGRRYNGKATAPLLRPDERTNELKPQGEAGASQY